MKAKNILGMLLVGIVGSLVGVIIYSGVHKDKTVVIQKEQSTPVQMTSYPGAGFAAPEFRLAAEKSIHAVVHVKTVTQYKQYGYDNLQDWFFGNPKTFNREVPGYGSGVIISSDGYIVTNNHVIENSNSIEVTLNDGRVLKAEIVGRDPQTDVAVIKVKENNLPYLTFGSSADMQVGDWVLAVGNPFNLQSTVTAGIISAKGRVIGIIGNRQQNYGRDQSGSQLIGIESFIQTDAVVNPGNSGGALVNLQGDLIGINTAIASQTGTYMGYSFAIPAAIAKRVVDDLIELGEVQRAVIGIIGGTVTEDLVKTEKLKVDQGVYVSDLAEDGGAIAAGVKSGDVIISVDGSRITNMNDLMGTLASHRPGEKVPVVVNRKGEEKILSVTLKAQKNETKTIGGNELLNYLGADIEPLTEKELEKYEITYGVKVKNIREGKLKEAGVPEGFIITDINKNVEIRQVEDLRQAIERSVANRSILVEGLMPNGKYAWFAFKK